MAFVSYLKNIIIANSKRICRSYIQIENNRKFCSSHSMTNANYFNLSEYSVELVRNFSIIAHVDHGKSTLADRILELTGAITRSSTNKQVLDRLQVEKERGITVKAQAASVTYEYNKKVYLLNLIDTPGHVDFSYEVSRSLNACQGVILLVDANDGIQAQTVSNFYLAFSKELCIIPVLNKIDLKNANPALVKDQLLDVFDIDPDTVLEVSAKFGTGVKNVIEAIIERVPDPSSICKVEMPFRGLIFDSWFEPYRGVICLIAIIDGKLKVGDVVTSIHSGRSYVVKTLGILTPDEVSVSELYTGQVGCLSANIKTTKEAQIGDTLHLKEVPVEPLTGFKPSKPVVYAGIFPIDQNEHSSLKSAIEKLVLNDSSVHIAKESSFALGEGWRVGFLGVLHMDVFTQRLEQEHSADVIITAPTVPYLIKLKSRSATKLHGKDEMIVSNPLHWPEQNIIEENQEPIVQGTIIFPDTYMGSIISLCEERRGVQLSLQNLDKSRMIVVYKLPLNEIIFDFYDQLKFLTSGYASFDYEELGYESSQLVKMSILLNSQEVQELSTIVHASKTRETGKRICEKLKESIPRQLFQIAIQAVVGSTVIVRENIRPLRKDVLAKCYGGDISRKMKLLKRQAEGKKRMRMYGNIEVPKDVFIKVLKR